MGVTVFQNCNERFQKNLAADETETTELASLNKRLMCWLRYSACYMLTLRDVGCVKPGVMFLGEHSQMKNHQCSSIALESNSTLLIQSTLY